MQLTETRSSDNGLSRAIVVVFALVAIALIGSRSSYSAIWDGRIYSACISAAADQFTLERLRCAGHASQAYAAAAALVQMLAPSSEVPLLAFNAILFAVACVGFNRLTTLAFPEIDSVERALLDAAFMVHPAFLAGVVQPSIDLPLLPAFVWAIVFALERRWLLLVLCGFWLAFTKETGVLLYAIVLACYAIWFVLRSTKPWKDRAMQVMRLWPLSIPGFAFIGYLMVRRLTSPKGQVLWMTGTTNNSLVEQFLIPHLDLYQVNYAVLLLILNFAWIPTAIVGMDAFVGIVRKAHREPKRPVPGGDSRTLGFVLLLTIVTAYALTRFTTFGHTRYFLTVYALAFIPFAASLGRLGVSTMVRRVIVGAYALVLAVSTVRTVDPVSRKLYGMFAFGDHEMLRMTRVTGECCAFGQDQLAYSLEFTAVQRLTDAAMSTVPQTAGVTLVVPDSTSWIFLDPAESGKRQFVNRRGTTNTPTVIEHRQVVDGTISPDSAHYLALPYGDNARAFRELAPLYEISADSTFRHDGYAISLYRMVRRRAAQP
jgi:hypothetical protein